MHTKNNSTQPRVTKEHRVREKLREEINACRDEFSELSTATEELKFELSAISHAYTARIGPLYEQQDAVDEQLRKEKEIGRLMRSGLSRKAAQKKLGTDDNQSPEIDPEYNNAEQETDSSPNQQEPDKTLLKKLWRELVSKFHPDLAQSPEDEVKRTAIIQQINLAYKHADIETLQRIQFETADTADIYTTTASLKKRLSFLKKALSKLQHEMHKLEHSVWFSWRTKINNAAREGRDLLEELSEQIRFTIQEKKTRLAKMKERHDRQTVTKKRKKALNRPAD